MPIELVDQPSEETLAGINDLIPQLSSSAKLLDFDALETLVNQPDVFLFVYREDGTNEDDPTLPGPIKAMLTLVTFAIPTGVRAWVEDVVVDTNLRGGGVGKQLVQAACSFATQLGVRSVDLTSRPSREAANRLYQRCGFKPRETNVYRYQQEN